MSDHDDEHRAASVLDRLEESAERDRPAEKGEAGQDEFTVGDFVEGFGTKSYGPFLLVPALIELSPLGGVPGVPTMLALIIAIFAVQMLMGRDCFWLPGFLRRRKVGADRLQKGAEKVRPVADWLDRHTGSRLESLTGDAGVRAAAACVLVLCLTVPPLEVFPFASSAPMAAIAAFGVALLVGDGLLMLLGFVLTGVAIAAGLGFFAFGGGPGEGPGGGSGG